jgi:hypothetical protein
MNVYIMHNVFYSLAYSAVVLAVAIILFDRREV